MTSTNVPGNDEDAGYSAGPDDDILEEVDHRDDDVIEVEVVDVDVLLIDDDPGEHAADAPNTCTEGDDDDPDVIPGTTNEDIANS